jgi:Flp pilus assembly protein TadG
MNWFFTERTIPTPTRAAVRRRPGQAGQALILFALGAVALIGFAGLAVDGGRAYVDRRALQSGADTAAEAATQLLAYNFHLPQLAPQKTDADIKTAVTQQVNNSLSQGSGISPFPGSATDCKTTSTSAPSRLTATCAWYADQQGKLILWPASTAKAGEAVQVGNGTLPPVCPADTPDPVFGTVCTVGVTVAPYYTHPTTFMNALGISTASERAVATAIFSSVITANQAGVARYAAAACAQGIEDNPDLDANDDVDPGDSVVIRDNNWSSTFTGCGLPNGVGSNDFKGWYHDPLVTTPASSIPTNPAPASCSQATCGIYSAANPTSNPPPALVAGAAKTDYTEFDYFQAKGGNAIGQQRSDPGAIPLIHSTWLSCQPVAAGGQPPCKPMLIPVIDYYNGNGSSIDFHIREFVAAIPDQDWNSDSQHTWTATVVPNGIVARRADFGGCFTTPCPPVLRSGSVFISLFQ